jgi:preprotein translocase subunit SecA
MLKGLTKFFAGDSIGQDMERYSEIVQRINALEPDLRALSDEALKAKTTEFKERLASGETLDDLLPEAFAVVRETAIRTVGLRHFDVQLIGGITLHEGRIAEMKTGEGKTLVATMPIYLNALTGKGIHLVTVNDYLARRDARWMGPIFRFHGLEVGILQEAARTEHGRKAFIYDPTREAGQEDVYHLALVDRSEAYAADVTYGTNNEFGFDYLRDNMAQSLQARSQRGHHYAILDEVDNILIDEARTPLIISGPAQEDPDQYVEMARVVRQLSPEDYEVSERDRNISLTELGEDHVERLLGRPLHDLDRPEDITPEQARLMGYLEQSLRANFLFKRNKDYVVQGGRVIIVDEFTGRMMAGRRWSDGLHQAVEAKEGVRIRQENVTYATITLQNYFRMYEKLSGMTGTAITEAEEFNKIYEVDVLPLPTNLEFVASEEDSELLEIDFKENGHRFYYYTRRDEPDAEPVFWKRKDYQDAVYRTEEAKMRAVTMEILKRHVVGQPLLVGTTSVELSEKLSERLRAKMLQKLAIIEILRDAYLEAHDIPDDGMRVEELQQLYGPLDTLSNALMKPFGRDLEIVMNPGKEENLQRLAKILSLDPEHRARLAETLSSGIRHNVLNAKNHSAESQIIASAGSFGAVTIATNMAGRGVDIKLGGEFAEEVLASINRVLRRMEISDPESLNLEERLALLEEVDDEALGIYGAEVELFRRFMKEEELVRDAGGLHVIGSERHDARRIDNQLRGRAARQGDPGSSQFFLSLEDELMRLFGGEQVSGLMQRLNIDDATPIGHGIVNKTIEQSQTRVEGTNFDRRKHLLEYDDVLNQQREIFYSQRNRVFGKDDLSEDIQELLSAEVEAHVAAAMEDEEGPWRLLAWLEETQPTLGLDTEHPYPSFMLRLLLDSIHETDEQKELQAALMDIGKKSLEAQASHTRIAAEGHVERAISSLDDQVKQRAELADMAIEGTLLEAEELDAQPNANEILAAVENAVGLRFQVDGNTRQQIQEDPNRFRDSVPQLIEAGLGARVWNGLIQVIQRRVGEQLDVVQIETPIDWDQAEIELFAALDRVEEQRVERLQTEITRELEGVFAQTDPGGEPAIIRALVQMSYSKQKTFDSRSHQARELIVPRLSYAFYAAGLVDLEEQADLTERILQHLAGAKAAVQRLVGEAELRRSGIDSFNDDLQAELRAGLGEEAYQETRAAGTLRQDVREQVHLILGSALVAEAHRRLLLSVGDQLWVDYLTEMEALRTSIGLEAYGQRDPLVQYKSRAVDMFRGLLANIRAGVVSRMYRLQVGAPQPTRAVQPSRKPVAPAKTNDKPQKSRKRRRRRRR